MLVFIRKPVLTCAFLLMLVFGAMTAAEAAWANDLTATNNPLKAQEALQDGSSFFNNIESGTATYDADTKTLMCSDIVADWMQVNGDITIKGKMTLSGFPLWLSNISAYTIDCSGSLTIQDANIVILTSANDGISCSSLNMISGSLWLNPRYHGIYCTGNFRLYGGTVTSASIYGASEDNPKSAVIANGGLSVWGGSLLAGGGYNGIETDGNIDISGGHCTH